MNGSDEFSDPKLKQALVREASRLEVEPSLASSVEAMFAQAEAPAPIPIRRGRWLMLAAAVVVAGLSVSLFTLRHEHEDDWDAEYSIAEARLWPGMASLYRPDASTTAPPVDPSTIDGVALKGPRYQLLATRADKIDFIDCTVRDYRRDDGAIFTLVTAPAAKFFRDDHHEEEEEDETYDRRSGAVRIVGGVKKDFWVCVVAPETAPSDLFNEVLEHVVPETK